MKRTLTTTQIALKMNGMTNAAILYWVKKGCPCDSRPTAGRRTTRRFNEQEVKEWAENHFGKIVQDINKVMVG